MFGFNPFSHLEKTQKIYTYTSNVNNSKSIIYIKFYVSEYSKITIIKQKKMLSFLIWKTHFLSLKKMLTISI